MLDRLVLVDLRREAMVIIGPRQLFLSVKINRDAIRVAHENTKFFINSRVDGLLVGGISFGVTYFVMKDGKYLS